MKRLLERYVRCFPEKLRAKNGLRLIGREAEFPVVNTDGSAGDVQVPTRTIFADTSVV